VCAKFAASFQRLLARLPVASTNPFVLIEVAKFYFCPINNGNAISRFCPALIDVFFTAMSSSGHFAIN
jgi:hypothetical protein